MPGRDLPQGGWVLPGAFVGRKYPVEVLGATAELVSRNVLSRGIDRKKDLDLAAAEDPDGRRAGPM